MRLKSGAVLVELVLDLLVAQLLRPSEHQLREEHGGLGQALQVLGVAVAEGHREADRLASVLLGQEGELDAGDRLGGDHTPLDGHGAASNASPGPELSRPS